MSSTLCSHGVSLRDVSEGRGQRSGSYKAVHDAGKCRGHTTSESEDATTDRPDQLSLTPRAKRRSVKLRPAVERYIHQTKGYLQDVALQGKVEEAVKHALRTPPPRLVPRLVILHVRLGVVAIRLWHSRWSLGRADK